MPDTDYLFFFSYARDDREFDSDDRIFRFYGDLEGALKRRGATEPGFFDTRSTATGDFWTPAADHALRTCKVFVSAYSPCYFASEYCGQEWEIFSRRIEKYRKIAQGKSTPSLIMPILFVGLPLVQEKLKDMSKSIRDIVYRHHDDLPKYIENGLEVFMLSKYKDDYQEFVGRFATRLLELSKNHLLPAGDNKISVAEVKSAFHQATPRKPTPQPQTADFVEFLYLVGNRAEMENIRIYVESYGDVGADWRAYEPMFDGKIGLLAQTVANKEGFISSIVTLDKSLKDWLDETKKNNHIAAIVVDTWTLQEQIYANIASYYDDYDSIHALMLVCMNKDDEETNRRATELARKVNAILRTKTTRGIQSNFVFPVSTSEEFESNLSATLGKIRMELLATSLDRLREGLSQPAHSKKRLEPVYALPSIAGSGGV